MRTTIQTLKKQYEAAYKSTKTWIKFLADVLKLLGIVEIHQLAQWILSAVTVPPTVAVMIQVICCALGYFSLDAVIFQAVFQVKMKAWKNRHTGIWLEGEWLHIHVKENAVSASDDYHIRIGTVQIKQYLEQIEVSGRNISVGEHQNKTKWHYLCATPIESERQSTPVLIGAYQASRFKSCAQENKYGLHIIADMEKDRKGRPVRLEGYFFDTAAPDTEKRAELGRLYMYRMTEPMYRYLYHIPEKKKAKKQRGDPEMERLAGILNDHHAGLEDEPFVKALRTQVRKRQIRKKE